MIYDCPMINDVHMSSFDTPFLGVISYNIIYWYVKHCLFDQDAEHFRWNTL